MLALSAALPSVFHPRFIGCTDDLCSPQGIAAFVQAWFELVFSNCSLLAVRDCHHQTSDSITDHVLSTTLFGTKGLSVDRLATSICFELMLLIAKGKEFIAGRPLNISQLQKKEPP